MDTKNCTKCGEVKSVAEFPKDWRLLSGLSSQCRECHAARSKRYYQKNREKVNLKTREWLTKHPDVTGYRKEYYETNRDRISEQAKRRYQQNKEKYRQLRTRISAEDWALRKAASKERSKESSALRVAQLRARRREEKMVAQAVADIDSILTRGVKARKPKSKLCPILKVYSLDYYRAAQKAAKAERDAKIPVEVKRQLVKDWKKRNPAKVSAQRYRRRAILTNLPTADLTDQEWEFIKRMYDYRCAYCRQEKPLTRDHVIPVTKGGPHTASNIVPACRPCNSRKGNRLLGRPPVPLKGINTDQLLRNAERFMKVLMRDT